MIAPDINYIVHRRGTVHFWDGHCHDVSKVFDLSVSMVNTSSLAFNVVNFLPLLQYALWISRAFLRFSPAILQPMIILFLTSAIYVIYVLYSSTSGFAPISLKTERGPSKWPPYTISFAKNLYYVELPWDMRTRKPASINCSPLETEWLVMSASICFRLISKFSIITLHLGWYLELNVCVTGNIPVTEHTFKNTDWNRYQVM